MMRQETDRQTDRQENRFVMTMCVCSSAYAAKECNLAIILLCTTFTFLLLHLPR